jgi:hypothetical protein
MAPVVGTAAAALHRFAAQTVLKEEAFSVDCFTPVIQLVQKSVTNRCYRPVFYQCAAKKSNSNC